MALEPSLQRCSNITANLRTSGFIGSGKEADEFLASPWEGFLKNSRERMPKIMSAVIPLTNSSYNFERIALNCFGLYS
jgi:hypothetical protein